MPWNTGKRLVILCLCILPYTAPTHASFPVYFSEALRATSQDQRINELCEGLSDNDRMRIEDICGRIDPNSVTSFLLLVSDTLKAEPNPSKKVWFVKTLALYPPPFWITASACITRLFMGLEMWTQACLFESLKAVTGHRQQEFLVQMNTLLSYECNSHKKKTLIHGLTLFPNVAWTREARDQLWRLFENLPESHIEHLMKTFGTVDIKNRKPLIEVINKLKIEEIRKDLLIDLIRCLAALPEAHWTEDQCEELGLLLETLKVDSRRLWLDQLWSLPLLERLPRIQAMSQKQTSLSHVDDAYRTIFTDMSKAAREQIRAIVKKIPHETQSIFVNILDKTLRDEKDETLIVDLSRGFSLLPKNEWTAVRLQELQRFFGRSSSTRRLQILNALEQSPPENRVRKMTHAMGLQSSAERLRALDVSPRRTLSPSSSASSSSTSASTSASSSTSTSPIISPRHEDEES